MGIIAVKRIRVNKKLFVLQPGVLLDNYLAGLKTVKEYGSYPIGGI
jgi:hypothetical protein